MGGSVLPAWGSAEGPWVSHAVLPSLLGKSLWLGDGFMEVWVRRLAVWLTSILSVSRTVLLWFGPLDTTQTIPQPCKSRGGLGGLEQGGQFLMALLLGGAWLARFPPGAQNPPVLSVRLQVSHSQQAVIHSQGRVQAG